MHWLFQSDANFRLVRMVWNSLPVAIRTFKKLGDYDRRVPIRLQWEELLNILLDVSHSNILNKIFFFDLIRVNDFVEESSELIIHHHVWMNVFNVGWWWWSSTKNQKSKIKNQRRANSKRGGNKHWFWTSLEADDVNVQHILFVYNDFYFLILTSMLFISDTNSMSPQTFI